MLAHSQRLIAFTLASAAFATSAVAQDSTFIRFANVGQSYSAAIFDGDPRIGRQVISATVTLHLTVNAGSSAEYFVTDLLLPVDSGAVVIIDGNELNWAGSGQFDLVYETTALNGTFIARRYGAETFGVAGSITNDSGVTLHFASTSCLADFNSDSIVDFFDYLDFVAAFADNLPTADFNADTVVDFFDYLDFVQAFSNGC